MDIYNSNVFFDAISFIKKRKISDNLGSPLNDKKTVFENSLCSWIINKLTLFYVVQEKQFNEVVGTSETNVTVSSKQKV